MLYEIFSAVFITSIIGALLTLFLLAIKPVTKRIFGHLWHYYIWLAVLLVMLLPIKVQLPAVQLPIYHTPESTELSELRHNTADTESTAVFNAQDIFNISQLLPKIWLAGVLLSGFCFCFGYIRLLRRIKNNSKLCEYPELYILRAHKITVLTCTGITSPFIMGILRPTLVLPDTDICKSRLNNIILHEMTHFNRKDILYKWLTAFVRSLHWFNPFIHIAAAKINEECEISCDLTVLSKMNTTEEASYIETILSLIEKGRTSPFTTAIADNKSALKRRFIMIKNRKKTSVVISCISAVFAVAILSASLLASGVLASQKDGKKTVVTENGSITYAADGRILRLQSYPVKGKAITNGFGERVHPITGEKHTHNGIDFKADEGDLVYSAINGVVSTGYDTEMGYYVIVSSGTVSTLYGHLSKITVPDGVDVINGTVIGKVGKTGNATGSVLHFEIMADGVYQNPETMFEN